MAKAVDWCGVRSGRDYDKWQHTKLTPQPGHKVACPYVKESPLSIECRVREIMKLGSHDMIIGEVLDVLADKELIDPETGAFDSERQGSSLTATDTITDWEPKSDASAGLSRKRSERLESHFFFINFAPIKTSTFYPTKCNEKRHRYF